MHTAQGRRHVDLAPSGQERGPVAGHERGLSSEGSSRPALLAGSRPSRGGRRLGPAMPLGIGSASPTRKAPQVERAHPENVSAGGTSGKGSVAQSLGRYRPAARARTPWSSSERASGPDDGGEGASAEGASRSGGASDRRGLTGLGPDETGECSPNEGEPGSDPSEKALLVRERRGDTGVGDDDEEEEDAIVAEGATGARGEDAEGGGELGRTAPEKRP